MYYNRINISVPLSYNSSGKFEAPGTEWIHDKRVTNNFELIIPTEGKLYLEVESRKYCVTVGEFLLIQPGNPESTSEKVTYKGYQPSKCSFYWLHFSSSFHSFAMPHPIDFIATDHNVYLPTHSTLYRPSKVLLYLRQLQDCMRSAYPNMLDYGNYLTTMILCELYHQFLKQYRSFPHLTAIRKDVLSEETSHTKQLYHDMVDYIQMNLAANLSAEKIAAYFNYSAKYLSLLCKKNSGYSLKQYILKTKMEHANYLLLDTNTRISSIAGQLGFSDSHNFTRAYKNLMGMSPSEYRHSFAKKIRN